jgi:hypothetical protein
MYFISQMYLFKAESLLVVNVDDDFREIHRLTVRLLVRVERSCLAQLHGAALAILQRLVGRATQAHCQHRKSN